MPQTNRSGSIDALRVVGIVAVVAGHVWDTPLVRDVVYPWHVPLFFFLTGYFWSTSRGLRDEIPRRTRTLLYPYVFWLIVIGIVYLTVTGVAEHRFPLSNFGRMLLGGDYLGRPFSAYWFVTALFFAAIYLRALQRLPQWLVWVAVGGSVVIMYFVGSKVALVPLSAGVAVPCLVFVMAGAFFKNHRHLKIAAPLPAALALIACAALVGFGVSMPLDLKQGDFGTPLLSVLVAIAICCALVVLFESLIPLLGSGFGAASTWLALSGFMVILTHAFILWVLNTPPTGSWLDFGLALVVPWVVAAILLKTPLKSIALGVRAPSRAAVRH